MSGADDNANPTAGPAILGVNHITVRTSHLQQSLDFYTQVLNMRMVHRGQRDVYLEAGSLWLCLLDRPEEIPVSSAAAGGVDHIALSVTEGDFREFEQRVRAAGCRIEREPVQRGDGWSFCFRSPEGVLWEIHTGTLHGRLANWK